MDPVARHLRTSVFLLGLIATVLFGWVLHVGAGILQPLVIALLLANTLAPVVRTLSRWHVPPALTVVALVVLLFIGLAQAGLLLQANVAQFLGAAPSEAHSIDPLSPEQVERSSEFGWSAIVENVRQRLEASSTPKPVVGMITDSLEGVDPATLARGGISSGIDFTRVLVIVMIYMIFMFAEARIFRRKILAIAGTRRDSAEETLRHLSLGIQRYLSVKTVISLLTGTLCYLLLVACQVPYALLLAFGTFLLNYIPTFGSIVAGIFASLIALAATGSWEVTAIVATGYVAVNLVLGSYLEPKILGRELNLSPLVIIVSVVVWGGVWGIVGAFLAVPLTNALQIVLWNFERTRPIAIMLSSGRTIGEGGDTGGATVASVPSPASGE